MFPAHRRAAALLFLFLLLAILPSAQGVTVTLQQGNLPTAAYAGTLDTFVTNGTTSNASPARNYGGAGALAVSADTTVNPANTQGQFLSFLQFDTSTAKSAFDTQFGAGGWTVTGVQLQLTAQSPGNAIFNGFSGGTNTAGNIDLRWLAANLTSADEGTGTPGVSSTSGMTFNNYTTYTGGSDQALGTFAFGGGTSGLFTMNATLGTGLLNDILAGGLTAFELKPSTGSQVSALFNSRNFTGGGSPGSRPALAITAVATAAPEPGRMMLVLLGGFVTVMRRRRAGVQS